MMLDRDPWPLVCPSCGHTEYGNPLPAAVLLVPYQDGLLGVRRNIDPGKDGLAFPGGFINRREPWRVAAARELDEELHIHVHPNAISTYDVRDAEKPNVILIFGLAPHLNGDLPPFVPNDEVQERVILHAGDTLVFPTHQEVMDRYFSGLHGKPLW